MSTRDKETSPEPTPTCGRILIVDDEFSMRDSLTSWFLEDGHDVVSAASGEEALRRLQERRFDVALVDIKMPGMDGMELQERMHKIDPAMQIVMITAFATVDTAVRALKHGALDYVTKPVDPDDLGKIIAKAIERTHKPEGDATEAAAPSSAMKLRTSGAIIGESPAIQHVRAVIDQVAPTNATVLIRGESGTGKELIARAIHAGSQRRHFSLVTVNCGALSESLLESELFGHEKGAFTGAQFRRKGKLEIADGGTLFLDEVATLTPKSQVDLLRVLETKELTRLGGNDIIRVDFRVIAATNEDLEQLVRERKFREDLYYRINVFQVAAPPLRDRISDIPLLCRHFLQKLSLAMNKATVDLAPDALEKLSAYAWPGNVRELANVMERAFIVASGPVIKASDLSLSPMATGVAATNQGEKRDVVSTGSSARTGSGGASVATLGGASIGASIGASVSAPAIAPAGASSGAGDLSSSGFESLVEMEHQYIRKVLEQANWNITRAANVLKVDRATLYNKIKKYGLKK